MGKEREWGGASHWICLSLLITYFHILGSLLLEKLEEEKGIRDDNFSVY